MSDYPPEWKECLLGEVVGKISSGGTPKADNQDLYGGEIPFLRIDDITSSSKYLTSHKTTINERGLSESSAKIIPAGTLLLTMYGTIGRCCITTYPVATNQAIASFLEHPEIALEYLYYALEHKAREFTAVSSQTTQANISASVLKQTRIVVPPLPEQKKIAEILSGIDKAISIKRIRHERRLIAANLIFESLLSNIESRQAALSQIAHLERGKFSHRPRNDPAYYGGLYPFIQTGDIPKTGVAIREHKQTLNEKGLKVSRQFPAGTLVITIAATIGEVGILSYPACFPDSLVGIDPHKDKCDPVYLLFLLRRLKNTLLQMAPQSAQSNLNLEILGKLSVPLPSLPDQQRFSRMITCEDKRASAEDIEIMKLQYLKTAVANNLLSGRKRVTL
jgi:type I restriction enzyme S subunit